MYTHGRSLLSLLFAVVLSLSMLIRSTAGAPVPDSLEARQDGIPPAPADPPQQPGDGSGPWKSENAIWTDYLLVTKYRAVATGADIKGLHNAAHHMNYYLDDSGKDLAVTPENIMKDLANFKAAIRATAQNSAKAAYTTAAASLGTAATFTTPWAVYGYADGNFNDDWFYAMGAFSYSVSGKVTVSGGKAALEYVVHVFDRYNWDSGKSTDIGPINIKDDELARLHKVGLAREYVIRGSSAVQKVDAYDPNVTLPEPSTGGDGRGRT
ncbi:MAG: hypothetical protein M1839_001708 [Geoglossum umbratile]|nr:MAG: hypothetical protein M1839_001708 [Geoglossum umbratile]